MAKRIPRYIKTENPAYAEHMRELARSAGGFPGHGGYPEEDLYPEEYGKQLPPEGGWIMLLMAVHVGKELPDGNEPDGEVSASDYSKHGRKVARKVEHIDLPHLSIWYGMPQVASNGLRQASIQTPQGEVRVFPHEYQITDLSKWLEFDEKDGLYIHFLREEGLPEDAMFYLRSRGISKAEAQRMLLGSVRDPFLCWFSFHPDLAAYFGEGYGTPYIFGSKRRSA